MQVDFSILNQKGTPAIYADALAQRPSPGFSGRLFVDTDSPSTGIYRDTGTAWILISDPGGGSIPNLQQVTTVGAATTVNTVFGTGAPSPNTQLYVNDIAPFNGNNIATFFVSKENTLPGSGAIVNGPAYTPITAKFVNTLTGNTTIPNGVSAWGNVYAGTEYNLAGFTLTQTQSGGARFISNYKTQNVFTGTPGTLSHLAQFWGAPLYDPTVGAYNGTVSNVFGMYLSNLTEQATAIVLPNRFAFYQAGTQDANVFFGKVSIGTDVLTTYTANVEGSLRVLGDAYFVASAGARVGIGTNAPTNALHVVGSARATTGFAANDGTAGSPSFYFTSDADTGIYRIGTNILGFSAVGVERLRIGQKSVGVNTPGGTDSSAAFQVDATDQGILVPRMTTAQILAIGTPANGLLVYNTTLNHLCCYQGGVWVKFSHSPM